MNTTLCRFCGHELGETFADLGVSPLSNAFVHPKMVDHQEQVYPLHAKVCPACWLVQLPEIQSPDLIFSEYLYFSSFSETWLHHARMFSDTAMRRFRLGASSTVVEIASNDGYLLQFFHAAGVAVLGVEPAENVAQVAIAKGIPTEIAFFGCATAERLRAAGCRPDLIVANNVLAHVPDINDFVAGIALLLPSEGVAIIEFPHLLRLIENNQFDTIYHEHFSYLSLLTTEQIFLRHGLSVVEVEELETHGGSLRVHVRPCGHDTPQDSSVPVMLSHERAFGLESVEVYRDFARRIEAVKSDVVEFLVEAKRNGKTVLGYGAPAKGNTLLNYCGIGPDMLAFTVDRNPHKQGLLLPGSHIPVRAPEDLIAARPDYVFILPWNLRSEIIDQLSQIRAHGGAFAVPIPHLEIIP
ncbi:MAG: methyltransferase domain-containing protein [Rhodospirillales bacterium]|nr:methyltransferase domain-containing protein [Rhodospirillales bacterium]MDE2318511.1 class I SAM-dependent methyltransferase [Rhodospirillales bacterium]